MKGLSDTNVSYFGDLSSPVSSMWFVWKVEKEMTLAQEANLWFMFVAPEQQPTEQEAAWDQRLEQVVFFGRQSWYIICHGCTQLGYLLSIAAWAWLNQPRNGDTNDKKGNKLGMAKPHFLAACRRNAPFSWLAPFPSNLWSCYTGTSPHMAQTQTRHFF